MKEFEKNYNPAEIEDRLYEKWQEKKYFHAEVDRSRKPFTIVMPPPNITGQLHMGHALDNTMQDILIRFKRMQGYEALWLPGTDHASIATEAKIVEKMREEGITKEDIGRDAFLDRAWAWKKQYGGRIVSQLKKIGSSCDWDRERFTMDEGCSKAVKEVFVNLYNKKQIYKGERIINWCPHCLTSISDAEVEYEDQAGKFWHLRYPLTDGSGYIQLATTRPETLLGDTAVAVNPNDDRYKHLVGKTLTLPLVGREIPIVADDYVGIDFGTGVVKITPAHDPNDFEVGLRHNLPVINVLTDDAKIVDDYPKYAGMDRYEARKAIVEVLDKEGYLVKIEDHEHNVGTCYRCHTTIEPRVSKQWFVKMEEIAKPAIEAVKNGDTKFVPPHFDKTYYHWLENIRDWCISRQLWWGHQIPVYYLPDSNDYVVAENITEAVRLVKEKFGKDIPAEQLRQDEDCLDTWFSSWLWPISVFNGILEPDNEDINYYYPTNDLVSGPDILFFWMARMIMAGYEYRHEKPFSNLYLTGIVRDKLHRKMSKSLGNSPDPIDLINQYGADGVRVGMLLCAPAGGDLLFDESLPEQGRNFTTKIWNAFRLVSNWKVTDLEQPLHSKLALEWFEQYLNKCKETLNTQFEQYRISEALMTVYTGFRDEFSSWLLEIIKPGFEQPIDRTTYDKTIYLFEEMLQLLHPFMPFITEEIWQNLRERKDGESIMVSVMPSPGKYDDNFLNTFENMKEVIAGIRTIRKQNNIAFKDTISLRVKSNDRYPLQFENIIRKMGNIQDVEMVNDTVKGAWSFICDTVEYFIPAVGEVNTEEVRAKLQADLAYAQGFLASVMKKLSNEKFVSGAPAQVVENERKKQADAEAKIKAIEQQLAELK